MLRDFDYCELMRETNTAEKMCFPPINHGGNYNGIIETSRKDSHPFNSIKINMNCWLCLLYTNCTVLSVLCIFF